MPATRPAQVIGPFEVCIQCQCLRVWLVGTCNPVDVEGRNVIDADCCDALNSNLLNDVGTYQTRVVVVPLTRKACPRLIHHRGTEQVRPGNDCAAGSTYLITLTDRRQSRFARSQRELS